MTRFPTPSQIHKPRPSKKLSRDTDTTANSTQDLPAPGYRSQPVQTAPATRNFFLMALYYVIVRTGWIFKTESIIMPAVLDSIGGGGWLRGCLPMLNRFGQSVPPVLFSDRARNLAYKKYGLCACSAVMGICFLALAILWKVAGQQPNAWLPVLFLLIYGIFFVSIGLNQLLMSMLIGKLIPARRRGRLMLVSTVIGSGSAITFAWLLLRPWLSRDGGQFEFIFMFTGIAFLLGGLVLVFVGERSDTDRHPKRSGLRLFRSSFSALAGDANFRLLAIVAATFGMSMTLFPHYQALGRGRLDLGFDVLVMWVIAQHVGAAFFSIPAGWMADRFGNRLVLRMLMLILCGAPVLALSLAGIGGAAQDWYFCVFCLIGLTPITMRVFSNYALEIAGSKNHARYLSTLALCMAGPAILTSTLLGALVDWVGFEFVFGFVVACVFAGWVLTRWLKEPRGVAVRESEVPSEP